MKCPHCGKDTDEQADSDLLAPLGLEQDRTRTKGGNKTRRRTQLSPTWQPGPKERTYCEQQGKDPDAMAEAFKAYYYAKGTVWKDWGLVWMKACREWKNGDRKIAAWIEESEHERNLSQWRARLTAKHWNPFWGPKRGEPGCMIPKELLK